MDAARPEELECARSDTARGGGAAGSKNSIEWFRAPRLRGTDERQWSGERYEKYK